MISAEVAITTYAAPRRLEVILEAFDRFGWPTVPVKVYEDVSSDEYSGTYEKICSKRGLEYKRLPKWGGMQGSAQFAAENTSSDWMIYFPDDVLPTRNSMILIENNISMMPEHVGAIQIPYWNYEQLSGVEPVVTSADLSKIRASIPMFSRDAMFTGSLDWLDLVPWNPHWYGPAFYLNVNGAGFCLRMETWRKTGGFPTRTWCLDEHISCKIWLETDYTIASVPGAPIVHMGGASTPAQHRFGHTQLREATLDGWMDEWGIGKDELGARGRARMAEAAARYGWEAR